MYAKSFSSIVPFESFDLYQKYNEDLCIKCPSSSFKYISHDETTCYEDCTNDSGYPLKDNVNHKCVSVCDSSSFNNGNQTCENKCIAPYIYTIYGKKECVSSCLYPLYTSETEKTCYSDCSESRTNPIANDDGYICTTACKGKNQYLLVDLDGKKRCVNKCPTDPINKPYIKRNGLQKECVASCDSLVH